MQSLARGAKEGVLFDHVKALHYVSSGRTEVCVTPTLRHVVGGRMHQANIRHRPPHVYIIDHEMNIIMMIMRRSVSALVHKAYTYLDATDNN